MNERRQKQYVSLENARKRVAKGAARLDKHFGNGEWRESIDQDKLNLSSEDTCILGQVFGKYSTGATKLRFKAFPTSWHEEHPSRINTVAVSNGFLFYSDWLT